MILIRNKYYFFRNYLLLFILKITFWMKRKSHA